MLSDIASVTLNLAVSSFYTCPVSGEAMHALRYSVTLEASGGQPVGLLQLLLWQIYNVTRLEYRPVLSLQRVTSGGPGVDSVFQPEGAIS